MNHKSEIHLKEDDECVFGLRCLWVLQATEFLKQEIASSRWPAATSSSPGMFLVCKGRCSATGWSRSTSPPSLSGPSTSPSTWSAPSTAALSAFCLSPLHIAWPSLLFLQPRVRRTGSRPKPRISQPTGLLEGQFKTLVASINILPSGKVPNLLWAAQGGQRQAQCQD